MPWFNKFNITFFHVLIQNNITLIFKKIFKLLAYSFDNFWIKLNTNDFWFEEKFLQLNEILNGFILFWKILLWNSWENQCYFIKYYNTINRKKVTIVFEFNGWNFKSLYLVLNRFFLLQTFFKLLFLCNVFKLFFIKRNKYSMNTSDKWSRIFFVFYE